MNNFGKVLMLVFWLGFAVNSHFPLLGEYSAWLQWTGVTFAVVHMIECVIFRKHVRANYSKPAEGYLVVMLFGVLRTGEWIGKKR
ncbi:MAG: DUF1145 domain-containing protein [Zhongshania sp.]|uniref:DUF1145 domain-containing protein n=1 Tax=Zhongshania sp. TaxID=1971902 RepID=UPI00262E7556|nr:DUF1145 domain-containing protein [Zhongshania sp.]MDF1692792.1 DUF1145 domain-containing protein [Zhongshania sp.]